MISVNIKMPDAPDMEMLCRYLGYADEPVKALADGLYKRLKKVCAPKFTYRESAVERKGDGIYILNRKFGGEDIKKHLENCEGCILFALTLGIGADSLLRTLASGDMSQAVVCDTLASVLTEQLCDEAQKQIEKEYPNSFLTQRYSPGYGDLPLEANGDIVKMLDTQKRIGVASTESFLLLPRKSVTALIGVSDTEVKGHLAGCENCRMYDKCTFRKDGKSCGKDI